MNRRDFLNGGMAATALSLPILASCGASHEHKLQNAYKPQLVRAPERHPAGTIIVLPDERFLYYIYNNGRARRYIVGVGEAAHAWKGEAEIGRKAEWPRWTPTKEMLEADPEYYGEFAGGVPGGPSNPLGARAIYLYKDGVDTLYRIHGTNDPSSIGKAVSNGCIRMLNEHVIDLYNRVDVGSKVFVR